MEFVTPPALTRGDTVGVVVLGLDWGHTTPIAPLPIGGRAAVDPVEERITLSA